MNSGDIRRSRAYFTFLLERILNRTIMICLVMALILEPFMAGTILAETGPAVPGVLGIRDAIEIAVAHNPVAKAAAAKVSAAEERLSEAASGFYPRVGLSGSYNRTTSPMMAFGTRLNQGLIGAEDFLPDRLNNPDPIDDYGLTLSTTWSLYDSGQTWYGTSQARMGQDAAGFGRDRTIQVIIARTVSAYNGFLLARENLKTTRQALKTAEATLKLVKSRFTNGLVVKSDLLQTEVHISDLKQRVFQAESGVSISRAALCAAMGVDPDTLFEPGDELTVDPETTAPLSEWLQTAEEKRPDLLAMQAYEAVAETEIKKARATRLPGVALAAEYSTHADGINDGHDSYSIGAQVTLNLFSGFQVSARVREAEANLREVRAGREGLVQGISVETRTAYYQAKSAWEEIKVATAAETHAEEALRIVRDRYRNGMLTIVELLNSELSLQQTRTNRFRAIHDYNEARMKLALSAGTLDETLQ
jgi:outer membrane protein